MCSHVDQCPYRFPVCRGSLGPDRRTDGGPTSFRGPHRNIGPHGEKRKTYASVMHPCESVNSCARRAAGAHKTAMACPIYPREREHKIYRSQTRSSPIVSGGAPCRRMTPVRSPNARTGTGASRAISASHSDVRLDACTARPIPSSGPTPFDHIVGTRAPSSGVIVFLHNTIAPALEPANPAPSRHRLRTSDQSELAWRCSSRSFGDPPAM